MTSERIGIGRSVWISLGVLALTAVGCLITVMMVREHAQGAVLVEPRFIDFHERVEADVCTKEIRVTNRLPYSILYDEVGVDCTCIAVLCQDKLLSSANPLVIPSGETAMIEARLNLAGESGKVVRQFQLAASDKNAPEISCRVTAQVLQRMRVTPASIDLGEFAVGTRQPLHIVLSPPADEAKTALLEVDSSNTELISIGELSDEESPDFELHGNVLANEGGTIHEDILVHLDDGRPPIRIRVTGTARERFELVPTRIDLPRSSEKGPIYSARAKLRAFGSDGVNWSVVTASAGLKASLIDDELSADRVLLVELDTDAIPLAEGFVDLEGTVGTERHPLRLPVYFRGADAQL